MNQQQEGILMLVKNYLNDLSPADSNWPENVQIAVSCIHKNLFDASLNVSWLKDKCDINHKVFSARFAQYVGFYPKEYILHHRIKAAKRTLRDIDLPVTRVALAVGFNSLSAFCKAFKREMDMGPSDWREEVEEVA
ncbi:helix-turn-helix domain-containing protein [Fodinibius halophilus]|uniref:Helix-turn-helix transcriptional regulator n=1 Tax=Fodinibius halophilus TaxID=1736908 RepID=A0A6M1T3E0_9BACT|nr:AraC family transcriptional regulator [Fodinibius halophilus]NGP87735.1 helix-turn-helix transcriptional regulator [Fodinibius halophilus]